MEQPRKSKTQTAGARLIRKLVPELRALLRQDRLPAEAFLGIGVSGGADSLGMARLLVRRAGRFAKPHQWVWIHVQHGWKTDSESEKEASFIEKEAQAVGASFITLRAKSPQVEKTPEGWEAFSREERYRLFREWIASGKGQAVLTAHTLDDQAETLLWRICTGSFEARQSGILQEWEGIWRPGLQVRKRDWEQYLLSEEVSWIQDPTNEDPRFLRTQIRKDALPALERVFPRAVEHLAALAKIPSRNSKTTSEGMGSIPDELKQLLKRSGLALRRGNFIEISKRLALPQKNWVLELPQGVILSQTIKKNGKPLTPARSAPIVEEAVVSLGDGRMKVWSLSQIPNRKK